MTARLFVQQWRPGLASRKTWIGDEAKAARERIITVLGPSPSRSTSWPGRWRLRRAERMSLLELEMAGRVRYLGRPRRIGRERHRNVEPRGSQSNELFSWCSPAVGSWNSSSALGFGAPLTRTNISLSVFAIRELSQPVKVGNYCHGFELGGHVGDVAGDVEHFPRHSPMRRIVGSSRRSRGSALSASPPSGFVSQEACFLGHPIKLSHLPLLTLLKHHSFHREWRTRPFLEA